MKTILISITAALLFSLFAASTQGYQVIEIPVVVRDTIVVHDTLVIDTYKQMVKAIMNTETRSYDELAHGFHFDAKPISKNGLWYGMFQLSESYLESCDIAQILNWEIDDMLDPRIGLMTFMYKNFVQLHRFKKKFGKKALEQLTDEDLVRMHNQGYYGYERAYKKGDFSATDGYIKEYRKHFNKKLSGIQIHKNHNCK